MPFSVSSRTVCSVFSRWLDEYKEDFLSLGDPTPILRLAPLLPSDPPGSEIRRRLLKISEELSERALLSDSPTGSRAEPLAAAFMNLPCHLSLRLWFKVLLYSRLYSTMKFLLIWFLQTLVHPSIFQTLIRSQITGWITVLNKHSTLSTTV